MTQSSTSSSIISADSIVIWPQLANAELSVVAVRHRTATRKGNPYQKCPAVGVIVTAGGHATKGFRLPKRILLSLVLNPARVPKDQSTRHSTSRCCSAPSSIRRRSPRSAARHRAAHRQAGRNESPPDRSPCQRAYPVSPEYRSP